MTPESQHFAFGSPAPLARAVSVDIENAVLRLVVDGFERWREGGFTRFGDYEDHYTVRLVACMKEIRRERNLAFVPRYQFVEPSDDMSQGQSDPARAPRIDIAIAWDTLTDEAYLSIECKRLAPDDLARRYVACGIHRFVRGYYGAKVQTGAMVGYIIQGSPDAVLGRVNDHVKRSPAMGRMHTLRPRDPIEPLRTVFQSDHQRPDPFGTIRLTHLFFDVNGI